MTVMIYAYAFAFGTAILFAAICVTVILIKEHGLVGRLVRRIGAKFAVSEKR